MLGGFSEKLDCQVRARAVAGGAIEQRCASGTSCADEVFDRSDRIVRVRHHDVGILGGHAYRREIIDRTVGKALESGRQNGVPGGNGKQRVPVGRGTGDLSCGHCARRSRPAFDDDRLTKSLREPIGDDPGNQIDGTTGGKAMNDRDRSIRPALIGSSRRADQRREPASYHATTREVAHALDPLLWSCIRSAPAVGLQRRGCRAT